MDAAAVEHGRKVMREASTQLKEILVAGNLLILPGLPGPPPSREAPQEERAAWERATLELSCLAPLAGLPQVTAPSQTLAAKSDGLMLSIRSWLAHTGIQGCCYSRYPNK